MTSNQDLSVLNQALPWSFRWGRLGVTCSRLDHITSAVIGQWETTKFSLWYLSEFIWSNEGCRCIRCLGASCFRCFLEWNWLFLQFGFILPQTGLITCRVMRPVRGSKICVDCAGHKYSVERYDIYPILKMHVDYFATIAPVHGMPISFLPLFPDCRVFVTIFIWCIVLCPCCGLGVVTFR